jgi:hypothetical protein
VKHSHTGVLKWLDDYKSLHVNGIRSGDELYVGLKHKALHAQKNFALHVVLVFGNGQQREFVVHIDPFTLIGALREFIIKRIPGTTVGMDLMVPIIVDCANGVQNMAGVFLDSERTFSSYGLADSGAWKDEDQTIQVKPLLMGFRDSFRLFPINGLREVDSQLPQWLEIVKRFPSYLTTRRSELLDALVRGVPGCLRGRVWELLLFSKPFAQVKSRLVFEELVDSDVVDEGSERILEQICNDVGECIVHFLNCCYRDNKCFFLYPKIEPCPITLRFETKVDLGKRIFIKCFEDTRCLIASWVIVRG